MPDLNSALSEEKQIEITSFLNNRFKYFETLRNTFDDEIEEEVKLYNNIDDNIDNKKDWEEKVKIPYIYTIVQTIVARLMQIFFGSQNYIKIYGEKNPAAKVARPMTLWVQYVLDRMKFKAQARDFLEDSLVHRVNFIQVRPVMASAKKLKDVKFDVYSFHDVWFDTKARNVLETDMFIRKIIKMIDIKLNKDRYINIDKLEKSSPPDPMRQKQEYLSKHGGEISYYDPEKNNITDEVEILSYHGVYDFGTLESPEIKDVIFVWANRDVLIRAEEVDLDTENKKMIFPIRPMRQAKSLIGKSIPMLLKDMQRMLNEVASLRMQNFKLLIKLLFKYNKQGGVDLSECFARGGNAIGYEDNKDNINVFDIPNMIGPATLMGQEILQIMQQTTGATDFVMGTASARGGTETASGIKSITEQALFKFNMMAENIYDDMLDFINFVILIWIKYGKEQIIRQYPELSELIESSTDDLIEHGHFIDIELRDLAQRRDIEQAQFINASNILMPLIEKYGNLQEYLRQVVDRLDMDNVDDIINPPPELQKLLGQVGNAIQQIPEFAQLLQVALSNPKMLQTLLAMATGGPAAPAGGTPGASSPAVPTASKATPEEEAAGVTPRVGM